VLASFITLKPDHTSRTVVRWVKGKFNFSARDFSLATIENRNETLASVN
jgi:hypothetical protein